MDDHNKSILRTQQESATEICTERDAQLHADRRAWTQEAVAAERAWRSECGQDDLWDCERCWERCKSDESEDRWQPSKRRQDVDDEGERPMAHVLRGEANRARLGTAHIARARLRMTRRGRGGGGIGDMPRDQWR